MLRRLTWSTFRSALATPLALGSALALAAGCGNAPPPAAQPARAGDVVFFVPVTNKAVALTFDDGPNGASTLKILDALKEGGVHATFFLLGTNVEHYPDIARRIKADGHEIGNHSYSHQRLDPMPQRQAAESMLAGARAIERTTGVSPTLVRPPYGINGTGLMEFCRTQQCTAVGWSADGSDWNPRTPAEIAERILDQTVPGDILLLHDGMETAHDADRRSTADAVPLILKRLTEEGYTFLTVSELIRQTAPPLAEFENGVRLLGTSIRSRQMQPGDAMLVRYMWDVPVGMDPPSTAAFVHFRSDGAFRFQGDHPLPARGDARDMVVKRVLTIPADTPPGTYQCRIGLYDPSGSRLTRRVPLRTACAHGRRAVILPAEIEVLSKER